MRTLVLTVLVAANASAQQIYRWTDRHGEVHYTDDRSTIPANAKVQTTEGDEVTVVPNPQPREPRPVKPGPRAKPVTPAAPATPAGPVTVEITRVEVELSDADRAYIEDALKKAMASPRLAPWGGLRRSISVEIVTAAHIGEEAFGRAVGVDRMLLRAPSETHSGGHALHYEDAALHELAHLVEHQVAGLRRPRWFAEGFAAYVAGVAHQAQLEDVAWWVIHDGGPHPLDRIFAAKTTCRGQVAYETARRALVFLVSLVGEAGINGMFERRAQGASFADAFEAEASLSPDEFEAKFVESLRPHYYERAR